ncbi:hypothetical protein BDF20DRAFT_832530 [Mycotypha africana]|uniref:uncharacterized protein n=1 Tax=Mycotypha africana TaxID=64632 RepID=UPI00230103E4|nr:uncharacterized protein BDF20DRAFT_832530 [Mycotypha africana]KAI8987618.1 hypothetical protein BDF20DRAFT_832530 [Mycotypha africana]
MSFRNCLLKNTFTFRHTPLNRLTRVFSTRSGLTDDRTKKVIEEIKKLEYDLETKTKSRATNLQPINDKDIAEIYKEVSAPIGVRPKINTDYLEKLRIRFLDTRSNQIDRTTAPAQLPSSAALFQQQLKINDEDANKTACPGGENSMQEYSLQDFEQLIYVNSLAKRPAEAEKAFELMKDYNISPSVKSVNHLMDAYANTNDLNQTIAIFKRLKEFNLKPDVYSYGILIKAFVANKRMDDAMVVFEQIKKSSVVPTQPIFSTLISGYLKVNNIDKAWDIFDAMRLSYHQPDEVSFTLMLHACAKRGEIERALNLFEDMAGYNLYPTEVTFNTLIHACAKRPDYYHEAFNLLHQMQLTYGFKPDKFTFNTLLTACARNKDLKQARKILEAMLKDVEKKREEQSLLVPDSHTYTNMFWCYASYRPIPQQKKQKNIDNMNTAISTERHILPVDMPHKRSLVVKEAEWLFNQIIDKSLVTTPLLTAYLTVHISQKQPARKIIHIYDDLFDKYDVERNAFTFFHMLDYCYKQKDTIMAWKVWEDYQEFLEKRIKDDSDEDQSLINKKAVEAKQYALAFSEGWTPEQQQKMAVLMTNTLARADNLKNAISILSTEINRCAMNLPLLSEILPAYNKTIQLEDEEAKEKLLQLCRRDPKKTAFKYRRVNNLK